VVTGSIPVRLTISKGGGSGSKGRLLFCFSRSIQILQKVLENSGKAFIWIGGIKIGKPFSYVTSINGAILEKDDSYILDIARSVGKNLMDDDIFGSGEFHEKSSQKNASRPFNRFLFVGGKGKNEIDPHPGLFLESGQDHRFLNKIIDPCGWNVWELQISCEPFMENCWRFGKLPN
jgi:hypothetical protein